jgi:hypothetical protein
MQTFWGNMAVFEVKLAVFKVNNYLFADHGCRNLQLQRGQRYFYSWSVNREQTYFDGWVELA